MKIPKDLKIRMGTEDQKLWEQIKKQCTGEIEAMEKALKVQRAFLELADKKIAEEIEKLK